MSHCSVPPLSAVLRQAEEHLSTLGASISSSARNVVPCVGPQLAACHTAPLSREGPWTHRFHEPMARHDIKALNTHPLSRCRSESPRVKFNMTRVVPPRPTQIPVQVENMGANASGGSLEVLARHFDGTVGQIQEALHSAWEREGEAREQLDVQARTLLSLDRRAKCFDGRLAALEARAIPSGGADDVATYFGKEQGSSSDVSWVSAQLGSGKPKQSQRPGTCDSPKKNMNDWLGELDSRLQENEAKQVEVAVGEASRQAKDATQSITQEFLKGPVTDVVNSQLKIAKAEFGAMLAAFKREVTEGLESTAASQNANVQRLEHLEEDLSAMHGLERRIEALEGRAERLQVGWDAEDSRVCSRLNELEAQTEKIFRRMSPGKGVVQDPVAEQNKRGTQFNLSQKRLSSRHTLGDTVRSVPAVAIPQTSITPRPAGYKMSPGSLYADLHSSQRLSTDILQHSLQRIRERTGPLGEFTGISSKATPRLAAATADIEEGDGPRWRMSSASLNNVPRNSENAQSMASPFDSALIRSESQVEESSREQSSYRAAPAGNERYQVHETNSTNTPSSASNEHSPERGMGDATSFGLGSIPELRLPAKRAGPASWDPILEKLGLEFAAAFPTNRLSSP